MRIAALIFLTACYCAGQSITLGALGGVRVTDVGVPGSTSEAKRYTVGMSLEVGLLAGFSIEAAGLYSRVGYQYSYSESSGSQFFSDSASERDNVWTIPLVLKYRIPLRPVHPFVLAGGARRSFSGSATYMDSSTNPVTGTYTSGGTGKTDYPTSAGAVVGLGAEPGFGKLRLSPQVRFTHWNNQQPSISSRQEVDLLVGIGWKLR
jgi:hypothetical protein